MYIYVYIGKNKVGMEEEWEQNVLPVGIARDFRNKAFLVWKGELLTRGTEFL